MNAIFEWVQSNSAWLYYIASAIGACITIYKYIRRKIARLEINTYLSLIKEVPLSVKNIERSQSLLYSEVQLQSKIIAAVLDTLELAHFLCDSKGKCIKVNSKWITLTGLPEREALGHNWLLAIHHDDRDRVQEKWQDMLENYTPFEEVFRYQHRLTHEITTVKCHATDVLDDNGNRVFILGFSRVVS
jgi:PAS domain S-box-containing protein